MLKSSVMRHGGAKADTCWCHHEASAICRMYILPDTLNLDTLLVDLDQAKIRPKRPERPAGIDLSSLKSLSTCSACGPHGVLPTCCQGIHITCLSHQDSVCGTL